MLSFIKFDFTGVRNSLSKFFPDKGGNVGIIFAVAATPLFITIGAATDYGYATTTRTDLQAATDSAALAGAQGTHLPASKRIEIARNVFNSNFREHSRFAQPTPVIAVAEDGKVTVSAHTDVSTSFLKLAKINDISVSTTSEARAVNAQPVCILALNATMPDAIKIGGKATLRATNCAVQSNSTSNSALYAGGTSTAEASAFCAPGGYDGFNFTPTPKTCPPVDDPYANLVFPTVGPCKYNNVKIKKQDGLVDLKPGVYCGGIDIATHAEVTMDAGMYIIKDGDFSVGSQAQVTGSELTFYFTGKNTAVDIDGGAIASLSAATTGTYAGFLFMQDPTSNPGQLNTINGGGTISLTGTFYFPTQALRVNGGGTFGIGSPLMPIIADHITVIGNGVVEVEIDIANMVAELPMINQGAMLLN